MLHRVLPWVWWLAWIFVTPTRWLRYDVSVFGDWKLPEGGLLMLPKHGTSFEIPWLGVEHRHRHGGYAYFQMGSFVGYRVFGALGPLFRALGGLPVMRPKEVRRLSQQPGWDRKQALERMREVNERAEVLRRTIFRGGKTLFVFPEGTRDSEKLRPLISHLEVESAIAVAKEGSPVALVPIVLSYGRRRWPRRRMLIDVQAPLPLTGNETADILDQVAATFERRWIAPDDVDAGKRPTDLPAAGATSDGAPPAAVETESP